MIRREAETKLRDLAAHFKAVAVIGPRQSGKTTLVKKVFPGKPYYSFENPDIRLWATDDPRGFLDAVKDGAILDEVQHVPHLFSYLQEVLDNTTRKGLYILTGSNNFLLEEKITQSLAGRIAYLKLMPFSIREIYSLVHDFSDDRLMWQGFYPPVYDQGLPPYDWVQNYIRTYVERDVRQIRNLRNLLPFERFLRLLAGRTATEWSAHALASDTGVDTKTIQSWTGILINSFLVFHLSPFYQNFNKRIVKRPKIYFFDTSLVCGLLQIRQSVHLAWHPLRGQIFETMVISDLFKYFLHRGTEPPLYYWRDKSGHEIDLLVETNREIIPIEIKSGQTASPEWFKNIIYWQQLTGQFKGYILYAGRQHMTYSNGITLMNWREFNRDVEKYLSL